MASSWSEFDSQVEALRGNLYVSLSSSSRTRRSTMISAEPRTKNSKVRSLTTFSSHQATSEALNVIFLAQSSSQPDTAKASTTSPNRSTVPNNGTATGRSPLLSLSCSRYLADELYRSMLYTDGNLTWVPPPSSSLRSSPSLRSSLSVPIR